MMRPEAPHPTKERPVAVLMILEWPDTPLETYERVNELMGLLDGAEPPDGLIDHIAAQDGAAIVMCEVGDSRAALEACFEPRLSGALREAGVAPAPPQIMEVHNRL